MDYLKLLERSHAMTDEICGHQQSSRLDWLGENVFNFTTYDSAMSELFAQKAVEVCRAISAGTTFDYIHDPENHKWYLLLCNTPFFSERIEWGTSIRGAWWVHKRIPFDATMLFDDNGDQILDMEFEREEWLSFVAAIIQYATPEGGTE